MRTFDLTGLRNTPPPLVTRFAPSPTGYLHLGHVVNAIFVWGIARATGARVLLRIEDHDRIRCRPEYEDALLEDLDWLGFEPDDGRFPLVRQSERGALYEEALTRLGRSHHLYACRCSRRIIGGERYPGTCRTLGLTKAISPALRIELEPGAETFADLMLGSQTQAPSEQCGDLLLRDRDGNWTYQFAVTVDDFDQGVNLIIRGEDLLSSTGRQIGLARLLGREKAPAFAHHSLILKDTGEKLSKANRDTGVRELRRRGMTAAEVIGLAAARAGLLDAAGEVAASSVRRFWDRI